MVEERTAYEDTSTFKPTIADFESNKQKITPEKC